MLQVNILYLRFDSLIQKLKLFVMKKIALVSILFLLVSFISVAGNSESQTTAVSDELVIVAHVTVKPEFQNEVSKAFEAVVEGTRKEEGNVSYILYQHTDNPLKYTFVEVWKSQAAINSHNTSAHFQEFAKSIDGKADLEVYTMKQKF